MQGQRAAARFGGDGDAQPQRARQVMLERGGIGIAYLPCARLSPTRAMLHEAFGHPHVEPPTDDLRCERRRIGGREQSARMARGQSALLQPPLHDVGKPSSLKVLAT